MKCYIKYNGKDILLGDDQFKCYTTFSQLYIAWRNNQLSQATGGMPPERIIRPGIQNYFRFPFPDENDIELGNPHLLDPARYLSVTMDRGDLWPVEGFSDSDYRSEQEIARNPNPNILNDTVTLELWRLCLWNIEGDVYLSPVFRDPVIQLYFLPIDEEWKIDFVVAQIRKHHVQKVTKEGPDFWNLVATVIKDVFKVPFFWKGLQ